jgi:hypothetical protein
MRKFFHDHQLLKWRKPSEGFLGVRSCATAATHFATPAIFLTVSGPYTPLPAGPGTPAATARCGTMRHDGSVGSVTFRLLAAASRYAKRIPVPGVARRVQHSLQMVEQQVSKHPPPKGRFHQREALP